MCRKALAASASDPTIASAVRMTIYDQNNNTVFTMVAYAGQPLSTGFLLLRGIRPNVASQ